MIFKPQKRIKELEAQNRELQALLKTQIDRAVKTVQELEQHKLYYIVFEEHNPQQIEHFKHVFDVVKSNLSWTMPNIVILDRPLTECDKETHDSIKKTLVEVSDKK